ncbi:MAG TPA: hypothetical protein PLQ32_10440 [Flavihumibacter sp.]|nr:hypothetical protein [Bacteroidota bacterium]HOA37656.1 hypothetical protein [Flavihumibacter sp.]HPZ88514.1 hypothetical protein [Flavihumibacter sp.]HQD10368.1 hypothetical protein [Flavihumibacter sp.]
MLNSILTCVLYALLNVTGAAMIKWKIREVVLTSFNDWFRFLFNPMVMGAFILLFGSALVLFKALAGGKFTFIVPLAVGINFVLTVIVGYFIFKDHLNLASFIGFALILSGIVVLSLNNSKYAA